MNQRELILISCKDIILRNQLKKKIINSVKNTLSIRVKRKI